MRKIIPPEELVDEIEWTCPKCKNVNEQKIFVGMPDKLTCQKCKWWFSGLKLKN